MSKRPSSSDLATPPEQPSAAEGGYDMAYYQRVLRHLVQTGDEFVEMCRLEARGQVEAAQRHPNPEVAPPLAPSPYITDSYERITRSMRRSIMLADKLAHPRKARAEEQRILARKKIIRDVEDTIHSNAGPGAAEKLHAELLERLEAPDLDDDIANRPIPEIVNEICRDLGLAGSYGSDTYKRRTPHDVAILCARAAQPPLRQAPPAARPP